MWVGGLDVDGHLNMRIYADPIPCKGVEWLPCLCAGSCGLGLHLVLSMAVERVFCHSRPNWGGRGGARCKRRLP